ncbi:MAG TPA: YbjQ family protein [Nevskiaceae bacterium]|nr:YbjQ family protein [Nevskiaceae bacterium]
MLVTTCNDVPGRRIAQTLGVVRGLVVRSPNVVSSIAGGLRSLLGGNIAEWERTCEAGREEAYARMVKHAQQMGADAIVAMRYDATEFIQGSTEVLAYGTAVKLAGPGA